jgi:hypothetical protein
MSCYFGCEQASRNRIKWTFTACFMLAGLASMAIYVVETTHCHTLWPWDDRSNEYGVVRHVERACNA